MWYKSLKFKKKERERGSILHHVSRVPVHSIFYTTESNYHK